MSGRAAIRDVSSCTCQPAPATGATRARRLSPARSPRRAGWEFGPPLDRHLGTSAHAIVTEQARTRRTSEMRLASGRPDRVRERPGHLDMYEPSGSVVRPRVAMSWRNPDPLLRNRRTLGERPG